MERELISQRVRAGLANARAQGKKIGRQKTRPSEVIRALLKQGYKYREISKIAGCSHGCVSAEKREMKREEAERLANEPLATKEEKPSLTLV
jgi:DNA invertase Pin-like site-specific DNA recombinase